MKRYFLVQALYFAFLATYAQQQAPSFSLKEPLSGNQIYEASQYIDMVDGFHYMATSSTDVFHAKINPYLIFPPEEGEFGGPYTDDHGLVGAIQGVFNVNAIGQATYTIPIQVPNGFNGFNPSVSINYSSQAANGLLGLGWSLSGVSSISRTGSTQYHDGATRGIKFDETDNFVLDGQRLMKISNLPNGSNDCEYRTEQESFSRIFSHTDGLMNGPESFTIIKKDGSKWHYGTTQNSRMEQSQLQTTTTYLWLLDRVEDVKGNYIEYLYTKNNNTAEIYIDAIKYTGYSDETSSINIPPTYEIKFEYIDRLDKEFAFIRDIKKVNNKLLKQIKINNLQEEKTIFRYNINYQCYSNYYLLSSVTLYDENGNQYNPLSYHWDKPQTHPSSIETILSIDKSFQFPGDYNGDGFTDLLQLPELTDAPYSNNDKLKLVLNNKNGGFITSNFEISLSPNFAFVKVCDIDGDLIADFLYCETDINGYSFQITPYRSNGNGSFTRLEPISYNEMLTGANSFSVGDFLGLGKSGLLIKRKWSINSVISSAWKLYYFDLLSNTMAMVGQGDIASWGDINEEGDFNGDGLMDIMIVNNDTTKIYSFSKNSEHNIVPAFYYNLGFPTIWHRVFTGDFNGDGKTDVLTYNTDSHVWSIAYFKETGFDYPYQIVNVPGDDPMQYVENLSFYRNQNNYSHRILDFDGNGKDDILTFSYVTPVVQNETLVSTAEFKTNMNIIYMFPDNKTVNFLDDFSNQNRFQNKTLLIGDFSGKGKSDLLITKSTQYLEVKLIESNLEPGVHIYVEKTFPSILKSFYRSEYLITQFSDGSDNGIYVNYEKLTSSDVYTNPGLMDYGSGVFDVCIPLNVVKSTTVEIVPNGDQTIAKITNFRYEGLKLHVHGKGLLGFTKTITSDNISNVFHESINAVNFNNIFLYPVTNTSFFQEIGQSNILSKQQSSFTRAIHYNNPKVYLLEPEWQLNHLYERPGVFQKTELIKYSYDNIEGSNNIIMYQYANIQEVTQSVSKELLYEHNSTYEHKKVTTYTYNDDPDYIALGLVSLVKDMKVVESSNEPGSVPIVSKTTNLYYPKNNLAGFPFIWKSVEKPNESENSTLLVENEYLDYDLRGNLLSVNVSAPNYLPSLDSRGSSNSYSDVYQYRFPTITTNALGQISTATYDPVYGKLKTSTDPNELTTYYDSNPLGTFKKTVSPDGTITTMVKRWATGHPYAPPQASYYTWQQTSGSPKILVFYHKTGAVLRTVTIGFDGSPLYVDKSYNDKGLLHKETLPYKKGDTPIYTEYLYDNYNRLQTVISPDNTTSTTTYSANKISVITTNSGLSRTTTKKYNAAGWLIESTDNFGSVVKNEYYCNGNLSKTYIVGQTAATVSLEYDHRGNRTLLIDPNYGSMATIYNAYGELVQQTNPRNETTMFTYDKLGRETKETGGPEGEINWTYSTSIGRIGTLETIIKNNHRTNYLYDNYLRLTSETEIIDGASYTTQYTYDELGRPFTTTHPTGIKLRNGYNDHGDLTTVTLEKDNKQLWKTENMNPMGQVTKFKTGNGLVTDQSYYPLSMRSYTVKTAKSGSDPIQDLEYGWYGLGNLEYRKKWLNRTNNTSLTESFTYDGLDRLEYIKLNGIETGYHEYDTYNGIQGIALGNITLKRNDNQAIYNNAIYGTNGYGPNAITEVTTANPILTGPRQDISYNGYDKIDSIIEGVHNLQIQYGHNRQRISQQYTDGDHTVDKVWAGACEYITKNGQQYKHTYLSGPMGVFAIHIINPDGTENLRYIHKDHLGSWNTITDEQGNLLQELSFDAWGNRRDPATWRAYTGTLPEPLFDRGFTGHEHLYAFNLINMNGRMYDPVLGRMLSPDNYMQAPDFSQNFNRYSYCVNNPLKYTDPSGEIFGSIFTFLWEGTKAVVKSKRDLVKTAFFEGGLDPTSSNARQNAWDNYGDDFRGYWAEFDPTTPGNKINNAIKIDAGLFLHIPGWETPQTIVGNLASHFRNLTGNVDNVDIDWKRFTVLVNDDDPGVQGWGFTFGPYINSKNLEVGDVTYMHEFGHTIQSRILGPLYITKVAIPSGLSYWFGSDDYHNNCWYEVWASRLGDAPNHQKEYRSKSFWYWFGVIGIPIFSN